ncbi:DUF4262 domain-containing protein [Mycolicibacterium thermoresistibile]
MNHADPKSTPHGALSDLFGPQVRALQLVWADDRGRWPWERGWMHGRRKQPVLGVRAGGSSAA